MGWIYRPSKAEDTTLVFCKNRMYRILMSEPILEIERRYFRGEQSREQFRAQILAGIPGWYSPWAHLGATVSVALATVVLSVVMIEGLSLAQLWIVPVVLFASNLLEWHAHKNLLHRRFKPLRVLYDRHTPQHHRVYRYGDMEIRSSRELKLVLIPAAGVAGVVAMSAPAAALVGWLAGANVGWLFLMTSALYVVSYELTHLAYHLPEESLIGRRRSIKRLRELHAQHHDPRLMQRYNFNVTVPLGDWLFRTRAPKELLEEIRRHPTATRAHEAQPGAHPCARRADRQSEILPTA
jgi:hypothetical protein